MKKELEIAEKKSPWTPAQVKLIKSTVAVGSTDDELKLFLYTASRTGLDPLTNQIHFVKRGGKMTIQTGIDGYRTIAERTRTLAGIDDAIYDSEEKSEPRKATVTVFRMVEGSRVSFTASARWSEYAPTGNQAFMWKKMPYLMLAKCAESLALRKAFPNDLTGIYTNEEMSQADNSTSVPKTTPNNVSEPKVIDSPQLEEPPLEVQNEPDFVEVVNVEVDKKETEKNDKPWEKWENNESIKTCPFCGKEHQGKYPKCIDCWKAEKNGETLKKQVKTKKIVNENVEPFKS